jgi:hypothetical protein
MVWAGWHDVCTKFHKNPSIVPKIGRNVSSTGTHRHKHPLSSYKIRNVGWNSCIFQLIDFRIYSRCVTKLSLKIQIQSTFISAVTLIFKAIQVSAHYRQTRHQIYRQSTDTAKIGTAYPTESVSISKSGNQGYCH